MWNEAAEIRAREMINLMAELEYYESYVPKKYLNEGIVSLMDEEIQLYQCDEDVLWMAVKNNWIKELVEDYYLLTDIGMLEASVNPESIRWIQSEF